MTSLEARSAMARTLAAAAYIASVALLVLLQEVGLKLRRAERRAWWASNGRDFLNAFGFAAVAGSLRGYGFPRAAAIAVGASVTLALFGTSIFMETQVETARPRAWALLLGLLLAAPVLLFPGYVLDAFMRVARGLFSVPG